MAAVLSDAPEFVQDQRRVRAQLAGDRM